MRARWVTLGIVLGVALCQAGETYGDAVVRHLMFLGGYVKASGALIDAPSTQAYTDEK